MQEDDFFDRIIDALSPDNLFYDIIAAFLWLLAALAFIYLPYINETFLRVLFALPVMLFIPGYSLIAALFPSNKEIDLIERVALSFGLSIAVVPLIGLGLNYTPWGISLDPVIISLSIFSFVMIVIAQYRRFIIEDRDRFMLPLRETLLEMKSRLSFEGKSGTDKILSVILIVSIIAAVMTTLFIITVPKKGESYTEFYLLGEKGAASFYPEQFTAGDSQVIIIGIKNHEYRDIRYILEAFAVDQVINETANTSSVISMELIDRIFLDIADNETLEVSYNFSIPSASYNKLQLVLFKDSVPEDEIWNMERINSGYRDLHLWIDVREPLI